MALPRPFRTAVLAALVAASLLTACSPESIPELSPEEQRLVDEALRLMTIRVEAARDAERAEQLRGELGTLYSQEELNALIDRLSRDSVRGPLVAAAIHESLQAMRPRLFPAEGPAPDPSTSRVKADDRP